MHRLQPHGALHGGSGFAWACDARRLSLDEADFDATAKRPGVTLESRDRGGVLRGARFESRNRGLCGPRSRGHFRLGQAGLGSSPQNLIEERELLGESLVGLSYFRPFSTTL